MTYHPALALALALTASAASAQHAVTLTVEGTDSAVFTVRTDGPVPVAFVELVAGSRNRGGAVFAAGTDGYLDWAHWAGPDRYSITTLEGDGTFALNFDGVALGDVPFSSRITSPFAWAGARAAVTWADGFYANLPMTRGMGPAVFDFTDIPPVPEPGTAALALAGLALILNHTRTRGASKNV